MKKMFSPSLLLIVIISSITLFCSCSKNDDDNNDFDNSINVIDKIKDPHFKAYIKLSLEKEWIKTADPNILTPAEAAVLNELSLSLVSNREKITSLEGIEYFTGLEKLYIHNTAVSVVDLTKNKKLTYVSISSCTAESMKIISPWVKEIYGKYTENISLTLETPELEKINCSDCKLKILDVNDCPKLTYLDCGGSKLISIDVSKNTELKLLRCGGFGCLTSGQLDVSNNKKLELLSCNQGAGSISRLYVWWEGGRDNVPKQLQGYDSLLGTKFVVNDKTQIIKK